MTRRAFVILLLCFAGAAQATPAYRAFLSWNGPYYQVRHAQSDDSSYSQYLVNAPLPLHSTPFAAPAALALWTGASSPALFVADAGHRRVQLFSAGANWRSEALVFNSNPQRGEFGGRVIRPGAAAWLPQSELVLLNGQPLTRVASLGGLGAADSVYVTEADGTLRLPSGWNLDATDEVAVEYGVAVPTGIAGMGDVDYVLAETTPSPLPLQLHDGSADGDPLMDSLAAVAVNTSTREDAALDLYLLNSGASGGLAAYTLSHVGLGGAFQFVDAYPSPLAHPADVEIVDRGGSQPGSVSVSAASGVSPARLAVTLSQSAMWNGHDYRLAFGFDTTSALNPPGVAGMVESDIVRDERSGRLHLALCRDAASAAMAYSFSDDGGESWSSPVTIATPALSATPGRVRLAIRATGELHVVFDVTYGTGERRLFHTYSTDGVTWSSAEDVAPELPAPTVMEHRQAVLRVDSQSDAVRLLWSADDTFLERRFTTAWSAIDTLLVGNGEGLRAPDALFDAAGRLHLVFSLGNSAPYRVGHLLEGEAGWGSFSGGEFQAGVIDTVCRAAGFADAGTGRGVPYPQPQLVRMGEALTVFWAGGGTERYGVDPADIYSNTLSAGGGDFSPAAVSAVTSGEDVAPLALAAVASDEGQIDLVYPFGTVPNREGLRARRWNGAWSPASNEPGRELFHAGLDAQTWALVPRVLPSRPGDEAAPLLVCTKTYAAWNGEPRALLKALDGTLFISDETTHTTLSRPRAFTLGTADANAIPGLTMTISGGTTQTSVTDDAGATEFNLGDSFTIDGTAPVWNDRLFVSESDSNRVRVIRAGGNADHSFGGAWHSETPGTSDGSPAQRYPLGAVGGENSYRVWVGADTAAWEIVSNFQSAAGNAQVCEVDRFAREVRFGDGAHGAIPPAGSDIRVGYALSADEAEFGAGQLLSPRGLAARYDSLHDRYDVYICNAGQQRLEKWAYRPDAGLDPDSWAELLTTWSTASSAADVLQSPRDIELVDAGDGVYLVVSDSTRLLVYRDGTPPQFIAAIDSGVGPWQQPQGLAVMSEDSGLAIFAADALGGRVAKMLRREWLVPGPPDTSAVPDAPAELSFSDPLDGDRTLLLQPGALRTVELRLAGADSLSAVDLYGSFPPEIVSVLAIERGELWDGASYVSQSFSASFDSAGNFAVHSAILGNAAGLSSSAARVVARLRLQGTAAMAIPATGAISLLDSSTLRRVNLDYVETVETDVLRLHGSYLADIASAGIDPGPAGAMLPVPDGHIDFEDVAAFVRAWNGDGAGFDPLVDLGPFTGETPAAFAAVPDGRRNAQDLLALSSMYSWEAAQSAASGMHLATTHDDGAVTLTARHISQGWEVAVRALTPGFYCAHLEMAFPQGATLPTIAPGEALGTVALLLTAARGQTLDLCAGRLQCDATKGGVLARFTWPGDELPPLTLAYDLRGGAGQTLAKGQTALSGALPPLSFALAAPYPNPFNGAATIRFTLAEAGRARLRLFNLLGQDLGLICDQPFVAGTHAIRWQAQDSGGRALPSGLYLLRLEASGHSATCKAILMR